MYHHRLYVLLMNIYILILLLCWTTQIECCTRVTFVNTLVKVVRDLEIEPTTGITVTGCITPEVITEQLGQVTITDIECNNQTIPTLHKKAVANLPEVSQVTLSFSKIKRITKNAFFNLPKLRNVFLGDNDIDTIEKNAFTNVSLELLSLDKNKLIFLQNGVFSNHPNLDTLDLSHNELDAFKPEWCSESLKLEAVYMAYNLIRTINHDTFKLFKMLQTIDLSFNQIKYIHANAFEGLTALQVLRLQGNRLSRLEPHLFRPLTNLSRLWLHENNLTYISDITLEDIASTPELTLTLYSNPWQCACYDKIVKWAAKMWVYLFEVSEICRSPDNPVCVISLENDNLCLEDREEDLDRVFYQAYNVSLDCGQEEFYLV